MKKPILFSILIGLFASLLSFENENTETQSFSSHYQELNNSIHQLEKVLNTRNKQGVMKKYIALRKNYKKLEVWFTYLDPTLVRMKLNGAPLPHQEENAPQETIIEAKGLQRIDELIVAIKERNEQADFLKCLDLLKEFKQEITFSKNFFTHVPNNSRMTFEMFRVNLLKSMSLESSQFNTPGTNTGLEDAIITLQTSGEYFNKKLQKLKASKKHIKKGNQVIQYGINLLENYKEDPDDFPYAKFIKECIIPAYQLSIEAQAQLNVEFLDEVNRQTGAINPRADKIFKESFLQKSFYSGVPEQDSSLIALGELLFYDPILSSNNQMACANCHQASKAFTDQLKTSKAIVNGNNLQRNAPTIINSVYASEYFWDLRANQIRDQIEHVIYSPLEFASSIANIETKLKSCKDYNKKFENAFKTYGSGGINKNNIEMALTAYVQSLSSWNSKVDKYLNGKVELDNNSIAGFNLFMGKGKCGTCHFPPTFSGLAPPYYRENESEVLGVPVHYQHGSDSMKIDQDLGRIKSTKLKDRISIHDRSFKTPTVRNAEHTFPYMHNGAIDNLDDLLSFYNEGGGLGIGFQLDNQTLPGDSLNLSAEEQQQIISFIKDLTDLSTFDKTEKLVFPSSSKSEWNKNRTTIAY